MKKNRSKVPGERLYVDTSSVRDKSRGGSKFWLMIADDATSKKWSFFLKKKDEQYDVLLNFLNNLKKTNVHTKSIGMILRMDNAGENIKFQKILRNNDLDIEVEFTPVDGPEYNGVVERGFATLYVRVRASLNGSGFLEKISINTGQNARVPQTTWMIF